MKKRCSICTWIFIVSAPMRAFPADWQFLYEDDIANYSHTTYFIDRSTKAQKGNIVSAWILATYRKARSIKNEDGTFDSYRSVKSLVNVNCSTHQLATVVDQAFSGHMGKGRILNEPSAGESSDAKDLRWEDPDLSPYVEKQSQLLCRSAGIPYTAVQNAKVISSLGLRGLVRHLEISAARRDILIATVVSNGRPINSDAYGLITVSLRDPSTPQQLGFVPILNAADFALSTDGKTAYVVSYRSGGFPEDEKYYGLFVVDLTEPQSPKILTHVAGSFFSMGLARKRTVLFLQENNFLSHDDLKDAGHDKIRAYSLDNRIPGDYCAADFDSPDQAGSVRADRFISFSDSDLVAISNRGGEIRTFDVTSPCKPTLLATIQNVGLGFVAGWKEGWLLSGAGGLSSYQYKSPELRWQGYASSFGSLLNIRVFEDAHLATAEAANRILVFGLGDEGCFWHLGSYHVRESWEAVPGRDSMLYVGGNGYLRTIKLKADADNSIRRTCDKYNAFQ